MRCRELKYWIVLALPAAALGLTQPLYASESARLPASRVFAISGGVGLDARAQLAGHARDHDLKLVFATKSGEYLADIPVQITNASGKTMVDQVSQGPWMLVELPPGHYIVQAALNGSSKTQHVTVSEHGLKTMLFRWPDSKAQNAGPTMSANMPGVQVASSATASSDPRPIEDLQAAAQRLRDATRDMAEAPPGPARVTAIQAADRALMEVNQAMANLPPPLLTAAATESDYRQAIDRLQQAAQRLRDASHALATDPYSTRRNETIRDINRALLETQQVMIDVPLSIWAKNAS